MHPGRNGRFIWRVKCVRLTDTRARAAAAARVESERVPTSLHTAAAAPAAPSHFSRKM